MSQFSTSETIHAPADEVFAFVTNFANMPLYLPTVQTATPAGEGQIRMTGGVDGKTYDTVGWYQVHSFNNTMLWGAKGQNEYSGDLEVVDEGDQCALTINLKFEALPEVTPEDRKKLEAHMPQIKQGLEEAGKRIKQLCEESFSHVGKGQKGYLS